MSPRLNRVWLLLPFLFLAIQAWALGLGDIRLSSALNEPLRAEIELLAATPEELNNLSVQLASQDTFQRYDLDRPMFLTSLQFNIVKSGRADGNVIRVTSTEPITEPFITFLVEASWSRGRLLREYTLLLDPPTFAPPPSTQATDSVTAPTRVAPADSGQIQRPAPQPQTAPPPSRPPVRPPSQVAEPAPQPSPFEADSTPPAAEPPAPAAQPEPDDSFGQPSFNTSPGGDVLVVRGDTLWGITQRVRPDSRLTINQTMLAIFEANPEAFDGNINRLRAGATLRIPSADDVFRISRADAFAEVRRQNQEWRGERPAPLAEPAPPVVAEEPVIEAVESQPSLTLVPPDEEDELTQPEAAVDVGTETPLDELDQGAEEPVADPVEARIAEIEAILEDPAALIAIEDNELAALRQELANLRGEELPPEEPLIDDEPVAEQPAEDVAPVVETAPPVVSQPARDEGIVDTLLGYLNNFWVWIGSALVLTVAILVLFMRRAARRDDEDATGVWDALDADDMADDEEMASTERLRALARDDESIVVVETQAGIDPDLSALSDTMESPAAEPEAAETPDILEMSGVHESPELAAPKHSQATDPLAATGSQSALEDTFSSETAINLDQSDPVAEADFHMAYGLYDQAADLINGALSADPERMELLAKLCEIYFVWGNRDAFVDAAQRMKVQVDSDSQAEWDKIIIMGQQIAPDHELFSGVSAEGVTKAVDLSFDGGADDAGELDMDFAGSPDDSSSDVIDLGGHDTDDFVDFGRASSQEFVADETGQVLIPPDSGSGIDFSLDDEEPDLEASVTREMPTSLDDGGDSDDGLTFDSAADNETREMPVAGDETTQLLSEESVRTPTIEQQFDMEATGELPSMREFGDSSLPADATAEIDLDDLGLDLDALEETAMAADVDEDANLGDLEDTATSEQLGIGDDLAATGRNEALVGDDALEATGRNEALDDDTATTSTREVLDLEKAMAADSTGIHEALSDDEATQIESLDDDDEDTDAGLDISLLDATGQTQVLTEDMAVETGTSIERNLSDADATMLASDLDDADASNPLADDAATLLASLDDDDDGDFDFAKTEALPKDVFSPNMSTDDTGRMPGLAGSTDMDLDLDDLTAALKVSEVGDTINQVRDDATVEQPRIRAGVSGGDSDSTQSLSPDDMSDDLHDARTMTEVGTKLDLARAYVDMGDPSGARSILEEVLDEGDEAQKQQAQQLIDSLPS